MLLLLCWVLAALVLGSCGGDGPTERPSRRTTTTALSGRTGAYGTVVAGPTCPMERPGQPCPPRPASVNIEARTRDGHPVGETTSDANGRYNITLAPGDYILSVVRSRLPRCPPATITVRPGRTTRADFICDTGIR
jgi:hypothetical protein